MGTGAGAHSFGNTKGARIASGDAIYKSQNLDYFDYIKHRKDIDPDGKFDVVAHGERLAIIYNHCGTDIRIDSRIAARLIKQNPQYKKGQTIRLLSCSTGSISNGFAQRLANKLGVKVEAPVDALWASKNGEHFIAPRSKVNRNRPGPIIKNGFKTFYPGGKK